MSAPAGTKKISAYGLHQTQIIRQKIVQDIIEYVKKEEYGKCSELLLIAVENGAVPLSEIWQPLVITIRQQNGAHLLDSILNSISAAEKNNPPFPASMERAFVELDRGNMTQAYASLMAFSENLGSKLALAHGYRGTLVACLREVDLRRRHTDVFFEASGFHVFSLSESVEFVLTKDDRDLASMFSLDDARVHLEKALALDPGLDMFRAIYAQVLVALDRADDARVNLEDYYKKCHDLHILKMIMAIDPQGILDQTDHMLDYLEGEPYASAERYFAPFMSRMMADGLDHSADLELLRRLLKIVLNRIELGEYVDIYPWQCLEHILIVAQKWHFWELVDTEFENRRYWWSKVFFGNANVLSNELDPDNIAVRERCRELLGMNVYEQDILFDPVDSAEDQYRSEDEDGSEASESDGVQDTDTEADASISDDIEIKAKLEP